MGDDVDWVRLTILNPRHVLDWPMYKLILVLRGTSKQGRNSGLSKNGDEPNGKGVSTVCALAERRQSSSRLQRLRRVRERLTVATLEGTAPAKTKTQKACPGRAHATGRGVADRSVGSQTAEQVCGCCCSRYCPHLLRALTPAAKRTHRPTHWGTLRADCPHLCCGRAEVVPALSRPQTRHQTQSVRCRCHRVQALPPLHVRPAHVRVHWGRTARERRERAAGERRWWRRG